MPEMSGFELIDEITDLNLKQNPSIVVATGGISTEHSPESLKKYDQYIESYLNKPYEEDVLKEILTQNIESKAS
jgi:CheY-like chemotaxis protein